MKPWLLVLVSLFSLGLAPLRTALGAPPVHSAFDLQVPVAPTPVRVEGMPRLVYELHLRSFAEEALLLTRLEVLADDGTSVMDLKSEALTRRLGRPGERSGAGGARGPQAGTLEPGAHAVLYLELPLGARKPPRELRHRLTCTRASREAEAPFSVTGARTEVLLQQPPVVLGPPLRGGPWAAIYEPSWERGHRRVLYAVDGRVRIPGRYAIDWIRLDAQGRYAREDEDRIAQWYGYGEDVLAVADATVAAVRDDVAESATVATNPKHALADASGNFVALALGNGRFAFYEHLRPGSVQVQVGQRVRRGQVLGSLGFTGDSTGPHLHFHVADASTPLGAEGVPYVLQSFDVLGAYGSLEHFGRAPWTPRRAAEAPRRHAELPAPNSVVVFEEPPERVRKR